jgi:hypothetical protein
MQDAKLKKIQGWKRWARVSITGYGFAVPSAAMIEQAGRTLD